MRIFTSQHPLSRFLLCIAHHSRVSWDTKGLQSANFHRKFPGYIWKFDRKDFKMEQLGSVVATDVPCSVIGTSSKILGTLDDNNAAARWWLERVD